MAISAPGIGSGLDVNGIVTSLMNAERAPLNRLKEKETSYNAKLSAFGKLKSSLTSLQNALKALSFDTLNKQKITSGSPTTLTATGNTTSKPVAGSYSVTVSTLAAAHRVASAGSANTTDTLLAADGTTNTGALTITVNGQEMGSYSGSYTLQGLSDAINASNKGVTASIVNTGAASNPYRLVVSSKESGVANQINISASGSLAQFHTASGTMSTVQPAVDAAVVVNGVAVSRSSNQLTDVIPGVTLQLIKADPLNPVEVKVGNDTEAAKEAITAFVAAYNSLSSTIKTQTGYDAASKKGGVLNGDQGANSILTQLRSELGKDSVAGGALKTLSEIGVRFQKDGTLAVDDTKLQTALGTKFNDVAQLFSSPDGFATRLSTLTNKMLAHDGLIANRTEGLERTIKSISKTEESMETRLVAVEKRLRAQFTALDSMLSSMQQTSAYLTQQLASLPTYE